MFLLTDNLNFTDDKFGKTKIHTQLEVFDFNHSGYFYSASSNPLLLRGSPAYSIDTVSELTRQSAAGNTSLCLTGLHITL